MKRIPSAYYFAVLLAALAQPAMSLQNISLAASPAPSLKLSGRQ